MLENYDPIILVTRGDELPKKNYEKKLHPTYETSIRLANGSQRHLVIKFFDQYRSLNDSLEKMGIGYGLAFPIDAQFPPTHKTSMFGLGLSEDALQQRCYMLNKWMQALFNNYHILPEKAQLLISDFLSLEDEDETREKNKNYILEMIKKKNEIKLPELIEKVNQEVAGISVSEASKRESDEPPLVLTPEVIAEISEPQTIYDILKVHVLRQVIDSRNRYEASINLISFDELADLPNKAQIDGVQYNLFSSTLPPLVITQTFDTYRQLKSQLQELGIFGRDKTDRFNDYNEDSSKAYHGIKLDAEFPKTYTQSAFGLGLNEEQLKTRTALLNRWVIAVLKSYKQFNPEAQEAVREFFEINDPDNTQHQTYITILNGCYEFPKLPPPAPKSIFGSSENSGATRRTSLLASLLPGGGSNPPPANNNYAPVNISAPAAKPTNGKPNNTEDERESDYRLSTATESPAPTNLQLADLQREVIVKDFLSVSVTKGEMLAKRKDEGKKHHGYLTTLRILYYDELDIPEKDKIDSELYEHNISLQLPAKKILKVFDGYRQLKLQLEENNIYSLDSVKEKDKDSDVIVIQASFPRTYTRSSLGLSLGENEIKTRTAELNYWLGNILIRYNEYSSNVQDIINEFLNLDDSPAEAENRVILSILKGSFNPPLIDVKKKQKPVKRDSLGGNGSSSNGNGGGDHRNSQDSGNNNGDGSRIPPNAGLRINTNTQSVTQGCACVIM